jgi:hypothetical protein
MKKRDNVPLNRKDCEIVKGDTNGANKGTINGISQ